MLFALVLSIDLVSQIWKIKFGKMFCNSNFFTKHCSKIKKTFRSGPPFLNVEKHWYKEMFSAPSPQTFSHILGRLNSNYPYRSMYKN
jgi:hypothetical protein